MSRASSCRPIATVLLCALLLSPLASSQILGGLLGSLTVSLTSTINAAVSLGVLDLAGSLLNIQAPCSCQDLEWSSGNIQQSGSGSLQLTGASNVYQSASSPLTLSGGSFSCANGGYLYHNYNSKVAFQSCQIHGAQLVQDSYSEVHLRSCNFAGPSVIQGTSAATTYIESGTTVHNAQTIYAAGPVRVQPGAECRFNKPCYTEGAGQLIVESSGHLNCQAQHVSPQPVVVYGQHTLNCAAQHSYQSLQYASGSTCNLQNSEQHAVQVAGQAQFSGHLNIQSNYAGSAPVTLYNCGSRVGQFSSASTSSSIKGAVGASGNAIVWYPQASQCPGSCVPCS